MTTAADPGLPLDKSDPGDEVQRRFRYQHAYCAIQCLRLLEPEPECVEIICENHEDVLIRLQSGKYVAVQIKTRKLDQALFRATDEAVKKAIARFARLEHSYPTRFEAFKFVTNFDYWKEKDNHDNLPFLLQLIQAKGSSKGWRATSPVKSYAKIICDEYAVLEESVLAALLKLRSEAHECGLDHTSHELIENLTRHSTLEAHNAQKVHDVAAALMFRVYTASSKVMGGNTIDLYKVVADHTSVRDHLILQGKILTTNIITEAIAHALKESTSALLGFHKSVSAQILLAGVGVLTEKMIRGGLQTERINKVKDYKASAETAYLRWRHKFSLNEANQRLTHLKTIVEDDCIEAKLAANNISKDPAYGPEMYVELRTRLNKRISSATVHSAQLFGFTEEHLLGVAGILTEECKVWWSEVFELSPRL
jgi:hypothetical protein